MKSWSLAFLPLVAACGGSEGGLQLGPLGNDGGPSAADDGGASERTPVADGGVVIDNGGSAKFSVSQVYLSRGQWCGNPPPFTPQDPFNLVLFGEPPSQPMPWPTIDIVVYASVTVGAPQTLSVAPWKPGPALAPGDNDVNTEEATADRADGNPLLAFSLARGLTPALPDPNPYDQATMTVLAIPKTEGDSLEVRVQLHFTDGATLDQTFVSPPLVEATTACGGA